MQNHGRFKGYNVLTLVMSVLMMNETALAHIPDDFVDIQRIDPTIMTSARYHTPDNFLGRMVPGYNSDKIYCTLACARALKKVNQSVKKYGYQLLVYDAYRPQTAVNAFVKWSKSKGDEAAKAYYYPTLPKNRLFALGYLREKSGHSRGSTVDLTLIKRGEAIKPIAYRERRLKNGEQIIYLDDNSVDMGSGFDLLHPVSHQNSHLITKSQQQNRQLLNRTMRQYGFRGVMAEWWHFTLVNEPYPNTYFDFLIK